MPFFSPENPGPLKIPVWVKLPYLPDEFRTEKSLRRIGSLIGKVLVCDVDTMNHNTRGVEKNYVEVNMNLPLKESIHIRVNNKVFIV